MKQLRTALTRSSPAWRVSPAGRLVVELPLGDRHHRVRVTQRDGWWSVEARVCQPSAVDDPPSVADLALQLLQASHDAEGLGFFREDDWLVVRGGCLQDAEASEVAEMVAHVGRSADRWELLWTGEDVL